MSALAEALARNQALAIAALGKQYVSSPEGVPISDAERMLTDIGCADKVEQKQLLASWSVQRLYGAQPAASQPSQNGPDRSKATDAQISLMRKIAGERNYVLPDDPQLLTRDQASSVIDSMKAGEYDQVAWAVPF